MKAKDWLCYTIRKEDNFKHLSLVTKNLQEIYDFITEVISDDPESFEFIITKEE